MKSIHYLYYSGTHSICSNTPIQFNLFLYWFSIEINLIQKEIFDSPNLTRLLFNAIYVFLLDGNKFGILMKWNKYLFHPISHYYTMQIHSEIHKISWNKNIFNLWIITENNENKLVLKYVPIANEENLINKQKKNIY